MMFALCVVVRTMENFVPKRVFTLLNKKPSEEIYEICITLKDVHGAVSETAKVLSDAYVNLRTSILFDAVEKSGVGYWTSFLDLSKAVKDVRQIEEALRKLDVVQDVKIVKPEPLAYDAIHFPITHGDSAAMVMPVELFGSLLDEIQKILTPSGFAAVFYNAGKKSGSFIAKLLSTRYGLSRESLTLALIQATKAIGWGQIEDFNMDGKALVGKVKVRMCFEALMRGRREEKVCHWSRGFVAGFLSEVVGKSVDAVETKCIATGDEICEFEVKPRI
jgi:predicted hydrocarbon binding protein